jgi:hypothetical protein
MVKLHHVHMYIYTYIYIRIYMGIHTDIFILQLLEGKSIEANYKLIRGEALVS